MLNGIITIDGFAGCGKTTISKHVSQRLGIPFFDSGLLYRYISYVIISRNINDYSKVLDYLSKIRINKDGSIYEIQQFESVLRNDIVDSNVSRISARPDIRHFVNNLIRNAFTNKAAVLNGRDIGTSVFPNAELKIFISATIEKRISNWERGQLAMNRRVDVSLRKDEINKLVRRDNEDLSRAQGRIVCPSDAYVFTLDENSIDEIESFIIN